MKDDVEVPKEVPRKRRALEAVPDVYLAVWLARGDLTPSETRRVMEEKSRRKFRQNETVAGVLVGREGMTPQQREAVDRWLFERDPKKTFEGLDQDDIKRASTVIAAPKGFMIPKEKVSGVWAAVKYARHRGLPVTVVFPDGRTTSGEGL